MNNLFVKMVGTFCSSSYMYLGWVLKNLCSSGTLACKSLNLHIIPFILFASLVGCSSSDSGSNLLPFNSFTPNSPPEFAIEIEGINPEEGIYYSKNSSPAFKFSNVRDGASVSLHEMEECAGELVSSDSTPVDGQVSVGLKNPITDDGEYTYYAKHANGAKVFDCLEIQYYLDTLAPAEPTIGLAQGTLSPSNNTTPSFVLSGVEDGALVSLHTDDQCAEANIESGTATGDSITLTLQTALSSDGIYNYYAKQVDRVGNISGCSSEGLDYELDTSALTPTIGLAQGTVSPSNNTTPSFVLSDVEDGALVSLHTDDQCMEANKVTSGTASGDSITLTLQTALSADGTYTYFAKQVDGIGNISSCSSEGFDYKLNTNVLLPITSLAQGTVNPSSNTTPGFMVSNIKNGALVSLHTDDQCAEASKVESGTATGDSITLTLQTALSSDGTYTYYAKQVDGGSNISPCSNGISYTLDTIALIPTLSLVTSSPSNNSTPTFSLGNLEIGGSVGLYSDNSCSTSAQDLIEITEESMEITLSMPLVNYSTYSYHTRQIDSFDNISDCSSAISYEFITPPFESVWAVGQSEYGDGDQSVTLPLRENDGNGNNFDYDFTVYWGDGSKETVTAYSNDITHEYTNPGDYTIKIIGPKLPAWYFNNGGDKNKIIEVKNLGVVGWKNLAAGFYDCRKLTRFTAGTTDTAQVTSMDYMFQSIAATSINLSGFSTEKVTSMDYMFQSIAATSINVSGFNTINVKSMNGMFWSTASLESLDLSDWNVSNVKDMNGMFAYASKLTTLNLSGWDTSSVAHMRSMFHYASSLTSLDLSDWNVSNVKSMYGMFANASKLTTLNLSGWDTSSVAHMKSMFANASSLTSLDLSNWNTSNVIYMHNMFAYASKLTTLNLSGWDTSNVTNMQSMFDYASGLESLDLSNWDTSNVTNMQSMFSDTSELTTLNLSGWDTSSVIDMHNMFSFSSNLSSLDLSHFVTSNVIYMHNMFAYASKLTTLNLSGWDVSNVTNMSAMFNAISSLTSLDLSHFVTSNVIYMHNMFAYASKLTTLNLSGWDTSSVIEMHNMFAYASGLESLDLSNWDTSSVTDMHNMFDYASGLESLDLSNWDTSSVIEMHNMFDYASGLESLDLSNWDTSNVTNMLSMFSNTSSLVSLNLSGWDVSTVKFSYSIFDNTHADLALTCSDSATDFFGKDCQ